MLKANKLPFKIELIREDISLEIIKRRIMSMIYYKQVSSSSKYSVRRTIGYSRLYIYNFPDIL